MTNFDDALKVHSGTSGCSVNLGDRGWSDMAERLERILMHSGDGDFMPGSRRSAGRSVWFSSCVGDSEAL